MPKKAAEHHKKASEHLTHAARHHGEAAKHYDTGDTLGATMLTQRGAMWFTPEGTLKRQ